MSKYINPEKIPYINGTKVTTKHHIEMVPAADVQEIKRGHWIIDRKYGNDVMSGEKMVICSVCGNGIFCGKQNYCPNCGALMEGEK